MQNQQITDVETHKYLGLYFSNDGHWHDQIQYIKGKALARINVMRKLKFKLVRKSLEIIYTAYIRPLLEYDDVVWDNCAQYEKDELEKIQHEAAQIATGAMRLVSLHFLYAEIKWHSLQKRHNNHKLSLLFKMKNNLMPDYLSSLLPQNVGNASRYNLRNSDNLQTLFSRTTHILIHSYRPQSGLGIIYLQKQSKLHQLIHSNSSFTAEEKKSPSTSTVGAEDVSFSTLDFEQTAAS